MRTTLTIDDEFQPGVDPGRLSEILDELETEDFLAKRGKPKATR